MGFGNIGIWEILIISVLVLIFFGPRRLPEIARSAGKAIREFKKGLNEIQRELELAEEEERRRAPASERSGRAKASDPPGRIAPEEARRETEPDPETAMPVSAAEPEAARPASGAEPEPRPTGASAGREPAATESEPTGAGPEPAAGVEPEPDPRQSDLFGSAAQG